MVINISNKELEKVFNRLAPEQQHEVVRFARSLAENLAADEGADKPRIRFEGWAGCLAHVEKSGVELQHEATAYRIQQELKDFGDAPRGQ